MMERQETRKLKVNLDELETAFDSGSWEMTFYLDLETGDIPLVTEDTRSAMEQIHQEIEVASDEDRQAAVRDAVARSDLPEWQRDAVLEASQVEVGDAERYLEIPQPDSRDGYRDMQDFIETVQDERLQERLWRAIDGRGAFRSFKNELFDHDDERQRWFTFQNARQRKRILDWLAVEGIEPIME